eukprot:UN27210
MSRDFKLKYQSSQQLIKEKGVLICKLNNEISELRKQLTMAQNSEYLQNLTDDERVTELQKELEDQYENRIELEKQLVEAKQMFENEKRK